MKAEWKEGPFPHVLLKDFYTDGELVHIADEVKRLDPHLLPPEQTGSARHQGTGQVTKFNSGVFLNVAMPNSQIIQFARGHITSELVDQLPNNWWKQCWQTNNHQSWLLSRYSNGQYYNAHTDMAQWTLLIWLYKEPKPFTGGDLIFTDYDITIPCISNTGIIFPGPMRHEVPPISGHGRYTITLFTGVGKT